MQNKILITGVAGLIGSNFAKYLVNEGQKVYGLDDLSGGYIDFIPDGVKWWGVNIVEARAVEKIFARINPDIVYHFAAYAAEGLSPFIRNFNYTNNLIASVNIINNCVKHNCKLIFTSSMAVYGHGKPPFKETDLPQPVDPYGIAKYAVEMDIKQAGEQFGLRYSIVRPHNIIGINQNIWDRYRNVIGIWIRQVLNGQPITIFGDGEQTRAFSDIEFYMRPFERLATGFDRETFNLGADREFKIKDVAEIVKKVAKEYKYNAHIEHFESRHEVKDAYCDHAKAKNILDFKDNTDIEKTIRKMFAWAIEQPHREIKQMAYELEKGMYSYWQK